MSKILTESQCEDFARDGYLFPLDCLKAEEAGACRSRLEAYEAEVGEAERGRLIRVKSHLAFPWMMDLARQPNILDAVEDLIGPDILLYLSSVWVKGAHDPGFVSWHQDGTYYGLDPHEEVAAWIALSNSTVESGCVRVIPGSHLGADLPHEETHDPDNLLSRGQTIAQVDGGGAVDMELAAGQFSLHHERLIHGSAPNNSDDRRIGISFMYIPARVRSSVGRGAAVLVRGEDRFGHWDADPEPRFDLDPVSMAAMARAQSGYRDENRRSEAERSGGER